MLDECTDHEFASDNVPKQSGGARVRVHACRSGLQDDEGGAAASRLACTRAPCSGEPCQVWPIRVGAQDILAGDGLRSRSEAAMAWSPWSLESPYLDQGRGSG